MTTPPSFKSRCDLLDEGAGPCEYWLNGGCCCPHRSRDGCSEICDNCAERLNAEVLPE